MSGKKTSPALYELYHKGKKTRGGLFGRRKKINIQNVYDIPSVPAAVSRNNGPVKATLSYSGNDVPAIDDDNDDSNVRFEVEYGRITMVMPVWLFVMLTLAILTSLLAAYKLGATPGVASAGADTMAADETVVVDDETRLDAEPSAEMIAALNSEPVSGLVQNSESIETANAERAGSGSTIVERPARCLIVFGNTNLEGLEHVQAYFASKGMALEIVKRSGAKGYTLVTQEGFVSTREAIYSQLTGKIKTIGMSYILKRESGWPRISERTFETAYPIDTSKLIYDWR